jgi:hypothetical protein
MLLLLAGGGVAPAVCVLAVAAGGNTGADGTSGTRAVSSTLVSCFAEAALASV